MVEEDNQKIRAAAELDQEARVVDQTVACPRGTVYDQQYQESHAEELAQRKEEERKEKWKRANAARAEKARETRASKRACIAGPSTTVPEE